MKLRAYHPDDLPQLVRLFRDTVRTVNLGDYTPAQVEAWAPDEQDLDRWRTKLAAEETVVAESAGEVIGFCSWEESGYLDFLYVHHAHQRRGVATALYAAAEAALKTKGAACIHTQASVTAQPFFLRQGFTLVCHQTVRARGVDLPNAVMVKALV